MGKADTLVSSFICFSCLSKAGRAGQVSRNAAFISASRTLSTYVGRRRADGACLSAQGFRRATISPIRLQRRYLLTKGGTAPTTLEEHQRQVEQISERVRGFYERKEKFRIYHGSTNSTRKSAMGRDPRTVVDTSRLNHVVSVDTERKVALVEPNVPMDRLVEETLKYGLVPPVVMEFPVS